jgi:membrane-bound metal-dependent hydrolase YbcI (DUF457 family)
LNIEQASIVPGITKMTPLDFTNYPISHSLLIVLVWGILIGVTGWRMSKKKKIGYVLFACVVSHWLLDFLVHRPDLPLYPGNSPKVGLGLWNHVAVAVIIESLIFVTGVYVYSRVTKARNKWGTVSLVLLVSCLGLIYIANIMGPPPPDMKAIAWAGNLQWIFVIMAFWVDRRRMIRTA